MAEHDEGSTQGQGPPPERSRQEGDEIERARERLVEEGRQAADTLTDGPTRDTPAGPLPERSLLAIGAFILAFLVVFALLWWALGGWGIALGLILGAAGGAYAVKLTAGHTGNG